MSLSLRPRRSLSGAMGLALTSPAAKTHNGVKENAPEKKDISSVANARPMRCSEERLSGVAEEGRLSRYGSYR